ncbi:MAG TPA: UDP-N-acetylmuramoyl-L-alanine--D-glutamate ligase [Candidatus Saccharimonadales bacterium]|nr:UDP-N-acetylmuramoyl-L-alanine--D-glutamate ligase [Candidatus Saccharimonadales bacterium]
MKIGIVGWGLEGKSAFNYFGPNHEYLIVNETPLDDFPEESAKIKVKYLSGGRPPGLTGNISDLSYLNDIENCDKIVYTPVARKNLEKLFPDDHSFWQKATTNQHIFFETVATKNVIGVTGTKGKGTTSTLITRMLEAAGKSVHFGGNVGRPVLDFVKEVKSDDWVVLELANFQLYKFPYSPHIAVCLMITPEHLEWHHDIDDYVEAKSNIFRHQKSDDIAIFFPNNKLSAKIAAYSPGHKIPYFHPPGVFVDSGSDIVSDGGKTKIINKEDVKLLGAHNLQNICAAVTTVLQVTDNLDAVRRILASFTGLEHRLEFVRDLEGVRYYDDSFGTTPDTAIVAMQAFSEPKIMVLGGHDKGSSFDEMARAVTKSNVRHVIAIGMTAPKIAKLLRDRGFTNITEGLTTMPEIVAEAQARAHAGDIVLLSTGCSSFGLFKDYKDRGNQFKKAVMALPA